MKFFQLYVFLLCISLGLSSNINAQSITVDGAAGRSFAGRDHDDRQSTLNLSRDLVSLGIASQNLIPDDPNLDARPLFEAALQYVGEHYTTIITLDHGAYYFLTSQNSQTYLVFSGLSDMRMDLAGSKIYFAHPFLQGFLVSNCHRVALTNFEADLLNLPYTHVQLESVDSQKRTLAYTTLPGWANPETFNGETTPLGPPVLWAVAFRNGSIVPVTSRMQVAQPISGGVLSLVQDKAPWTQSATLSMLAAGDTIVVTQRGGESLINASRSDDLQFSNITVYASSAMGVLLNSVSHSTVDHVRVMPRPESGLIASNADGIHFVLSGPDNHIRNSFVSRTLDDALAIDSLNLATVTGQNGSRQLTVQRSFYRRFPNGTAVHFVDPASAEELGGATIISQNPADSNSPGLDGAVELTFDRNLPAITPGFGMVFANANDRGAGSSIEGNEVREISFGRGVFIAVARGLFARNKISLRARTFNGEKLKVNDKRGNPIEIAAVIVWRVEDTAQALFDVDDYENYVPIQSESALRHLASMYPYDEGEGDEITLRSNLDEVAKALRAELQERLAKAGVAVDEARLTHLAYAPEIAQVMLRRQQAEAVIAARQKIVQGAVSMVDMALKELAAKDVVQLDDERRAAMVSNLMVVLCSESEVHPVVNTGTLYH